MIQRNKSPGNASQRDLARRRLRMAGALQNIVQSGEEILGVAEAFDDLHDQLVNNRIDNQDLKSRLREQIAEPLHQIGNQRMPQLATQVKLVEEHVEDAKAGQVGAGQRRSYWPTRSSWKCGRYSIGCGNWKTTTKRLPAPWHHRPTRKRSTGKRKSGRGSDWTSCLRTEEHLGKGAKRKGSARSDGGNHEAPSIFDPWIRSRPLAGACGHWIRARGRAGQ